MSKKILEVTEVTLTIQKTNPPKLVIKAEGKVPTGGWSNGQLIQFVYIMPPANGLYEFDFIADEPTGIATDVITDIQAEFVWEDFPTELKGVMVYASQNAKSSTLE